MIEIEPEELHIWYLEATKQLNPENFNEDAQKPFDELNGDQQIAYKILADNKMEVN